MHIVYHLGAHCTDEERLVRTLLRNRGTLSQLAVSIPPPGRYRPVIRDALAALRGAPAALDAQEALLDAILDAEDPTRIFFSNEYFLGMPIRAVGENGLYPTIGRRASAMANLFPDAICEFHIALRNPATLIPALIARAPGGTYQGLMGDTAPQAIRWHPVIRRLASMAPEARIVVWCNEDTPVIWPEVLRTAAGVEPGTAIEGEFDLAQSVMTPQGFERMSEFLRTHPPQSVGARRKIVTAFLEKFARPDAMEMEVALPGWTSMLIDDLTADYDADCDQIRRMERVEMILP